MNLNFEKMAYSLMMMGVFGEKLLIKEKYRPKGMFPSEVLTFLAACVTQSAMFAVESGVLNGFSSVMLRKIHGDVVSFEKNPTEAVLAEFGESLIVGDSMETIPEWLEQNTDKGPFGVLIDGPKGLKAIQLKDDIMAKFPAVKVVGIHDLLPNQGESLHTQNMPDGLDLLSKIDDRFVPAEWRAKYPNGPGLALWLRD